MNIRAFPALRKTMPRRSAKARPPFHLMPVLGSVVGAREKHRENFELERTRRLQVDDEFELVDRACCSRVANPPRCD
jgi:hypothetical protein